MLDAPEPPSGASAELARLLVPEFIERNLQLVVDGFEAWKQDGFPRYRDEEVPYTAVLIGRMRRVAQEQGLSFVPSPERVKYREDVLEGLADPAESPRIDIGIAWGATIAEEVFLSIECKRLARGTLAKRYVDQGMLRFITGHYAPDAAAGGMVGYVVAGTPGQVRDDVNVWIGSDARLGPAHMLEESAAIGPLSTVYRSQHDRRPQFSPIQLTHLLFDMRSLPTLPLGPPRKPRRRRRARRTPPAR